MNRQKVNSSTIVSVGWEEGVLEMEFSSGGVYQYEGVSKETFESFMRSESKGHFFQADIRPSYVCVRLHVEGCEAFACYKPKNDPNREECPCWCHKERHDVSKGTVDAQTTTQTTKQSKAKKGRHKGKPPSTPV